MIAPFTILQIAIADSLTIRAAQRFVSVSPTLAGWHVDENKRGIVA